MLTRRLQEAIDIHLVSFRLIILIHMFFSETRDRFGETGKLMLFFVLLKGFIFIPKNISLF